MPELVRNQQAGKGVSKLHVTCYRIPVTNVREHKKLNNDFSSFSRFSFYLLQREAPPCFRWLQMHWQSQERFFHRKQILLSFSGWHLHCLPAFGGQLLFPGTVDGETRENPGQYAYPGF